MISKDSNVVATIGDKPVKKGPGEETIVFFRSVTWMRDSHGLFDYESRNISKKNYKTKFTGKIIRQ